MFYLSQMFDKYQILLYLFYQNVYQFLRVSYNGMNFAFATLLISMGIFTVLTPCFISMFPILITYINSTVNQALNNILFIFGVLSSILCTFVLSNSVNLYYFFDKLPILSSLILICVSLNLMQIVNFSFIPQFVYRQLDWINNLNVNLYSYCIGVVIGFGSTPCNTSIILLLTFFLRHANNIIYLSSCLFMYLFGCFLVLLLILNLKISYKNFHYLGLLWNFIFPLSGSMLFIFSLLLFLRQSLL
uniref:Thiol:disulfide interchange protein n=1 Tax=Laurenciella marilzae TaxID=1413812 RepID=A0A1Z1M0T3_9FLOR|nr:thiol:disulfide interchange protein [Laurenciella marilzae]ARW59717.1 thiol:disulfide interchange protein [Laurenciella marilzae]